MKKRILLFALILSTLGAYAQKNSPVYSHATVVYNYDRNYFNENQALPAETNFILSGGVVPEVNIVEASIFRACDKKRKKPVYSAQWQRPAGNEDGLFSITMNNKLKSGGEYDFQIKYYRNLSDAEREYLRVKTFQTLDAYILSSLEVNKTAIKLQKPYRHIMSDLNTIVGDGLSIYQSRANFTFDGFSDVVKDKVKQIEGSDLNQGRFMFGGKRKDAKASYANKLVKDLQQLIHNEAEQYLNSDLQLLTETKTVEDYPVEKTQNSLSINAGYGAAYFGGKFKDLDYGAAPYVGVSLPLGRSAFSSFLGNASLSVGAFVTNFENSNGEEITGPIVKRPTYVGLGYKVFKFIRLNAGGTFTESASDNGGSLKSVKVRPFVGLSAEINLSLSFDK